MDPKYFRASHGWMELEELRRVDEAEHGGSFRIRGCLLIFKLIGIPVLIECSIPNRLESAVDIASQPKWRFIASPTPFS